MRLRSYSHWSLSSKFLFVASLFLAQGCCWQALALVERQEDASDNTEAAVTIPTTTLPLGDINIVSLTDTHSWVGGHGEKETLDVDYGDVLSFYRLLQGQIAALEASDPDKHKHDLFLVMNGDFVDGTGLAMNGDPSYLIPIIEKMPWDAVNIGNHELYNRNSIEYIKRPGGFAEWLGPKYLSSNIIMTETKEAMGNEYHFLRGKHTNLLVFGFLFNMVQNDPTVTVQKVHEALEEGWFEVALSSNDYDAILVLAHMGFDDPLVKMILERIRHFVPADMPVQFITGHTHRRGFARPDNYSTSFEAGRYLDTVGFVSIPTQTTIQQATAARAQAAAAAAASAAAASANSTTSAASNSTTTQPVNDTSAPNNEPVEEPETIDYKDQFQHMFIDAKYTALADSLGIEFMATDEGVALSNFIYNVQKDLGLYKIVGCVQNDHFLEFALNEPLSLWGMFCDHVVPHVFPSQTDKVARTGNPKVVLLSNGSWRYNLFAKELIMDEVIAVAPFNESLFIMPGVPGAVLAEINITLNDLEAFHEIGQELPAIPKYVMCNSPATSLPQPNEPNGAEKLYDLVVSQFSLHTIQNALQEVWANFTTPEVPDVPDASPLRHFTTTSMWLEFFDKTDLCQTENKGTHKTPKPKDRGHKAPGNQPPKNGGGGLGGFLGNALGKETEKDVFRIDFVWVAVVIVVIFTGIYIRQRGRIWHHRMRVRERATLEAEEEWNAQNNIGYRDTPDLNQSFDEGDESHELHFEIGDESDEFVNNGYSGDRRNGGPELDLL